MKSHFNKFRGLSSAPLSPAAPSKLFPGLRPAAWWAPGSPGPLMTVLRSLWWQNGYNPEYEYTLLLPRQHGPHQIQPILASARPELLLQSEHASLMCTAQNVAPTGMLITQGKAAECTYLWLRHTLSVCIFSVQWMKMEVEKPTNCFGATVKAFITYTFRKGRSHIYRLVSSEDGECKYTSSSHRFVRPTPEMGTWWCLADWTN